MHVQPCIPLAFESIEYTCRVILRIEFAAGYHATTNLEQDVRRVDVDPHEIISHGDDGIERYDS